METQYFIDIFLPEFVSATFDVVDMISSESCIDIYLDEKKIIPPDITNSHVISHGFTPSTTIEDFPVRGKAVHLHIRRRKWLDTHSGKVFTPTYDLTHHGTQLTKEFVFFLKATN